MRVQLIIPLLFLFHLTGCATWEKETLAYMGGALVAGAVIGAAQAPSGDDKAMHALLWGSIPSATAGAYRLYTRKPDAEIRERDLKIKDLNIRLSSQGDIENETLESTYGAEDMPEDIQRLIQPGLWKVFNINRWKKKARGKYVHEDKILEFKPPKVKLTK